MVYSWCRLNLWVSFDLGLFSTVYDRLMRWTGPINRVCDALTEDGSFCTTLNEHLPGKEEGRTGSENMHLLVAGLKEDQGDPARSSHACGRNEPAVQKMDSGAS